MFEGYFVPKQEKLIRGVKNTPEFLSSFFCLISMDGHFSVMENKELGYRRYIKGEGERVDFELLLSEDVNQILSHAGRVETKKAIKKEIEQITIDRHKRTIDPDAMMELKYERSVNAFSGELEERLGHPVAIKSKSTPSLETLSRREDLLEQFILMKSLEKDWQRLPDRVKNVLRMCKVYAAIRFRNSENENLKDWLVMERVENAKRIKSESIDPDPSSFRIGFFEREHPLLAGIVVRKESLDEEDRSGFSWKELQKVLARLGLDLPDLSGRNILYSEEDPQKRIYVIIDQYKYPKKGI